MSSMKEKHSKHSSLERIYVILRRTLLSGSPGDKSKTSRTLAVHDITGDTRKLLLICQNHKGNALANLFNLKDELKRPNLPQVLNKFSPIVEDATLTYLTCTFVLPFQNVQLELEKEWIKQSPAFF